MNKQALVKSLPHIVAILLFIVISYAYLTPIMEGKQLIGHDTQSWMQMAKETMDYNSTHSSPTLWTNSMFGGMPTYQISMTQPNNWIQYIENVMHVFPSPVFQFMLYLIGFYILLLAFRFNPWLAVVGSLAFTFASYNMIIIVAGHNSKAITIAYMAPLVGAVWLAFRNKKIVGGLLSALFMSLAIRANHVQILYYTLIVLLFFVLVETVYSFKEKQLKSLLQSVGVLLVAAIVAVGMNATTLLTTYEYSKATMRGNSNGLTTDSQNSQHGLNSDYITQWSYGVDETMTLLIPNFKGGASSSKLDADSETGKKLSSLGVPNVSETMKQFPLPTYWGTQPVTSGPVYLGAIVCFLFVLGLFIIDKRTKWWLVPVILLTLMLSWGKNFMWLTQLFIDYIPMYNKFRTVSMTLVATGFSITLIAMLALKELFTAEDKKKLVKPIYISAAITGGLALIFALIPSLAGSFTGAADAQFTGQYAFLKETLPLDREAMLRGDAFRSVLFILLNVALLWLYIKEKVSKNIAIALVGVLMLFDLIPVDKRYLNNDNFEHKRELSNLIPASKADNMIMQDKSQYRVMDATVDMFNDAAPSYFHKNIGGYHAAKLRRYQELINMQLTGEISHLFAGFNRAKSFDQLLPVLDSLPVLNMLNMKYIIYNKEAAPLVNPCANGNAWFVDKINIVPDANTEMHKLGEINTKHELVVDKAEAAILPAQLTPDTTARIALKSYEPNYLVYTFSSKTDQVAVFSEIYYKEGWNAYINGKEMPYTRVNYLLRAMPLKAGQYDIEFKFEPKSYKIGNMMALASSLLLVVAALGYIFFLFKKAKSK